MGHELLRSTSTCTVVCVCVCVCVCVYVRVCVCVCVCYKSMLVLFVVVPLSLVGWEEGGAHWLLYGVHGCVRMC